MTPQEFITVVSMATVPGRWPCLSSLEISSGPVDRQAAWNLPADDGTRTGDPFRRGWKTEKGAALMDATTIASISVAAAPDLLSAVAMASAYSMAAVSAELWHELNVLVSSLGVGQLPDVQGVIICDALSGGRLVVGVDSRPVLGVVSVDDSSGVAVALSDAGSIVLPAFSVPP